MKELMLKAALFLICISGCTSKDCHLPEELVEEIQGYKKTVNGIISAVTKGEFKGKTYEELAYFVDRFGARQVGGVVLEESINYLLDKMSSEGYELENVHGEDVSVPHWVRGAEQGQLLEPRVANIPVLALGGSVSTKSKGIEAEVIVFKSFDDLEANSSKVQNKIVVFNNDYVSYPVSVVYRSEGPIRAAKHGAVAVLIRSVTPFSLNTLHTGQTNYENGVPKIPAASITVEHAHMLQRIQDRGQNIKMRLVLQSNTLPNKISRNTVAELVGANYSEKVVLVSGHLDSWDVGVGAMDDGGGAFISWYSLVVLKALGLRPKRTIRAVLWTGEEPGLVGVQAYNKTHQDELDDFIFAMESDEGTFTPIGLEYVAGDKGGCILEEIMKLLEPINATKAKRSDSAVGSDISIWKDIIPTGSLLNENDRYFWFHHSQADTMDVLSPDALDKATALWASVAYVIADLKDDFPREMNEFSKCEGRYNATSTVLISFILILVRYVI